MNQYRYRNMTREKMQRKIRHLRYTNRSSSTSGATKRTWITFWKVLIELKLCKNSITIS